MKLDASATKMKFYLETLDQQVLEALRIGNEFSAPKKNTNIQKILFCGLGGSAASGEILRTLVARQCQIPFAIYRTTPIPEWVDDKTFAIFSSYSGNTEEVLRSFEQAIKVKAHILVVTSGGKLAELAKAKKIPYLLIPQGMPPRCAVGYLTFSLIPVFRKWGWVSVTDGELLEVVKVARKVSKAGSYAKSLAKKLIDKSIHIYGIFGLTQSAVVRWRAQLAENAKVLASHHFMPEMFHNEIEGWCLPKKLILQAVALFFIDKDDPEWIRKKRDVAQNIIRKSGAKVFTVSSIGKYPLSRIFSLICLGDRVSFELALLEGVNPLTIPAIDAVKKVK